MIQPLMSLLANGWLEGASHLILIFTLHVAIDSHEHDRKSGSVGSLSVLVSLLGLELN